MFEWKLLVLCLGLCQKDERGGWHCSELRELARHWLQFSMYVDVGEILSMGSLGV